MRVVVVLIFLYALNLGMVYAVEPEAERLFLQGKWQKAIQAYSSLKEPTEEDLNRLGEAYFYNGDYDSARATWQRAGGERARANLLMLDAIGSKRRLRALEEALEKEELSAPFWRALAIAYMKTADDERALYYFYEAINREPNDYMSYFFIGTIYENHFVFEDAAKAYKKAVEINPQFAQALNNLGYCYKEMRFWSYAIEYYKKALDIWPENPNYHYNIGNAYTHKGLYDEAFESYKRAVGLDPNFAKAHYNLGKAYLRRGMLEDALSELKLYIKLWSPAINPLDAPHPSAVKEEVKEIEGALRR